jgi:hypothetical protein
MLLVQITSPLPGGGGGGGGVKSNPKNAKSNLNNNLKSTLTTARALTHNTCYTHAIEKESRVLDS